MNCFEGARSAEGRARITLLSSHPHSGARQQPATACHPENAPAGEGSLPGRDTSSGLSKYRRRWRAEEPAPRASVKKVVGWDAGRK